MCEGISALELVAVRVADGVRVFVCVDERVAVRVLEKERVAEALCETVRVWLILRVCDEVAENVFDGVTLGDTVGVAVADGVGMGSHRTRLLPESHTYKPDRSVASDTPCGNARLVDVESVPLQL